MLATVGKLGHLEPVDVKLTDAGLAHLAGLRELRRLSLDNNLITDAGLARISGLTRLESLGLEGDEGHRCRPGAPEEPDRAPDASAH